MQFIPSKRANWMHDVPILRPTPAPNGSICRECPQLSPKNARPCHPRHFGSSSMKPIGLRRKNATPLTETKDLRHGGDSRLAAKSGFSVEWNKHEPVLPVRTWAPCARAAVPNLMGASRFRRDRLRPRRHVGGWASVIACKTKVADYSLPLAA